MDHFPSQMSGGSSSEWPLRGPLPNDPRFCCATSRRAPSREDRDYVLEAIERVNHDLGTLAVIITHNAAIADMANRVIHLSDAGSPRFMKQRAAPRADVVW